ncbi:MAG TPA: type II toxin-antitoxin system RelE/ParE family toxin [Sulfurovum sp.]|nr:type II toxin-antitoxin system RelE/ParE family toxin [Sulfurovum sp.]
MTIRKSIRFDDELQTISLFIALDNPSRALKFLDDITSKIEDIPHNPFSHRSRKSSKDKYTRELIFKGYTVPYYIDIEKDKIIILGIFNQNEWKN